MPAATPEGNPNHPQGPGMHVLVLPKWYTGRNDPQLGDFVRKQVLATHAVLSSQGKGRVSVVFTVPLNGLAQSNLEELEEREGAWELRCYYQPSTATWKILRKAQNFLLYWRAAQRGIARAMRERGRPDLVHVHILVRPALLAWWLRKWKDIPYLLSEQSSEYLDGTWAAKSAIFKAINHFLFRRARAVTAVSAHLGEGLKAHGLCQRYNVVPNVVPGLEHPLPPAGAPHRFMVVADLVDRIKNVSGVLRALRILVDEGHNAQLEVIGDGTDGASLRSQADALGIADRVTWSGRLANADVLRRMAGTGTVIINSNVETFSVVTGEALALGKPVIATRCGGPEAFITPENGRLIPVKDDQALAVAMIARRTDGVGNSPESIRASVGDRFSPQAVGSAFVELYERILQRA